MAFCSAALVGLVSFYLIMRRTTAATVKGRGFMGLDIDLAAVAGMAGLGGSTIAAVGAGLIFKGLIGRIIAQLIVTTVLSFIGFIALFNVLGFTIVPPAEIAGVPVPGSNTFSPASAPGDQAPAPQGYTIKSPWR
jgi:hypothetical protein